MELLEQSLEDLYLAVSSEDVGRHLQECEDLLQRHALAEADLDLYLERVHGINAQAQVFVDQGHPQSDVVAKRQAQLLELHEQTADLTADRKAQLEAAVALQLYLRDADELMAWIAGREATAGSSDVGRDLVAVNNQLRRHNALVAEIKEFEKSDVAPALASGLQLVAAGHFAADSIDGQNRAINAAFTALKAAASMRRRLLQHAVKTSTLRTEVDDAATKPRTWGRWWGLQYYVMWHWNQGSEFWKMVTDPSSSSRVCPGRVSASSLSLWSRISLIPKTRYLARISVLDREVILLI